ncbi:hypothetical protein ES708_03692 [subsurface metagenome]
MDIKQEIANVEAARQEQLDKGTAAAEQIQILSGQLSMLYQTEVGQRIIELLNNIAELKKVNQASALEILALDGELRALKRINGAKPKKGAKT